ncbi:unnamed protein product [Candida verbasci]|uniref:Uncharacterized protein n=1 Tax=Candida verbasci TaxID=1227364 RepID=A0A9W4U2M3_9ASCO|nr:unnamed protein product [Candida verbasci]
MLQSPINFKRDKLYPSSHSNTVLPTPQSTINPGRITRSRKSNTRKQQQQKRNQVHVLNSNLYNNLIKMESAIFEMKNQYVSSQLLKLVEESKQLLIIEKPIMIDDKLPCKSFDEFYKQEEPTEMNSSFETPRDKIKNEINSSPSLAPNSSPSTPKNTNYTFDNYLY